MTVATKNRAAVSGTVLALEAGVAAIRRRHRDVAKDIAVVVASKGKRAIRGYHAPQRWELGNETQAAELLIAAEFLQQGGRRIFTTLLHECVHSANFTREVKDTSRDGQYHNRNFSRLAEEFGLICQADPQIGCQTPDITDETAKLYKVEIAAIEKATKSHRHGEGEMPRKRNKNNKPAYCACEDPPNMVRLSTVMERDGVFHSRCGEPFTFRE